MKSTISTKERLQLIGLLALAERYSKQQSAVEEAIADILGDPKEGGYIDGHISDALYDDGHRDADGLLKRLKIAVED
jgi:hypothetical protein